MPDEDIITITISRAEAEWLAQYTEVVADDVVTRMARQARAALEGEKP